MPITFFSHEKAAFLARDIGLGPGWKGTKHLGTGGFAVAGLWEYQGNDRPGMARQVVIKQAEYRTIEEDADGGDVLNEGRIGARLAEIGSEHILKYYSGNILGNHFGEMGKILSLFVEYCDGGDLAQLLPTSEEDMKSKKPLAEIDVWAIFLCIAQGLAAMARRTEDPAAPAWQGQRQEMDEEILHGNLHVENSKFLNFR